MKTRLPIQYLSILVMALIGLEGCSATNLRTLSAPLSTALPTLSISSRATPTLQPIVSITTQVPTLIPVQQERMFKLLQANDCKLPCYLGITPGSTSLVESKLLLESLGASLSSETNGDSNGSRFYTYYLDIGDPFVQNETPGVNDALVYTVISLQARDGKIQTLDVIIATERSAESLAVFRQHWSRYSARGIFIQVGEPNKMYTGAKNRGNGIGSDLILIYEGGGAFIDLFGAPQENNICSEQEAPEIRLHMSLFDPAYYVLDIATFNPLLDNSSVWSPIEERLNIDREGFFDQVVADPSICFELNTSKP